MSSLERSVCFHTAHIISQRYEDTYAVNPPSHLISKNLRQILSSAPLERPDQPFGHWISWCSTYSSNFKLAEYWKWFNWARRSTMKKKKQNYQEPVILSIGVEVEGKEQDDVNVNQWQWQEQRSFELKQLRQVRPALGAVSRSVALSHWLTRSACD